ncbi:MAG: rhodanese-like domain-containing protein [Desulfurellaceae bacterium]|nr:rhodanese-like domain-containing protein [Desulfurellaceae bacterium]
MSSTTLTPQEAFERLKNDDATTYVDVRTVAEFATGHPKGKIINVPIVFFHPTTKAVFQNESFDLVMEEVCPKETPLIVGCEKGPRAKQAVERLAAAGYENIHLMEAGHAGWKAADLPVTADNRDGISYVSLLTPAKRKQKKKKKAKH